MALATATLDGGLAESDRLDTEAGRGAVQAVERRSRVPMSSSPPALGTAADAAWRYRP